MTYRISSAVFALCTLAAPAFAWDETTDFRGLHIYTASADGVVLTAVCDPDGAFIPPTNHLQIEVRGELLEGAYKLKSEAHTFASDMIAGAAISRDKADWNDIISVLHSGSEIELTAGNQIYKIDTGSSLPVTCGADV